MINDGFRRSPACFIKSISILFEINGSLMKNRFLSVTGALIILFSYSIPSMADDAKGPLSSNNIFPLFWMFLNPAPEKPFSVSKGELKLATNIDYASVFVNMSLGKWSALMDMETACVDLNMEYGITSDISVSCRVPFAYMYEGFMDGFIKNVHSGLGLPDYDRNTRPSNKFGYHLYYEEKKWFDVPSGGGYITDSTISSKYSFIRHDAFFPTDFALTYVLKLPTGDPDNGTGSGRFDQGFFILTNTALKSFNIFFNTGYILLARPETAGANIEPRNGLSIFLGSEYHLKDSVSLLAQFTFMNPLLKAPGINKFSYGEAQFDVGAIFSMNNKTNFEIAVSEDINGSTSPDFIIHCRISKVLAFD